MMAENKDEINTSLEQSSSSSSSSSSPHESLFFVLAYLPLLQLLSMTQVCKSLRDAINNDILPGMNIMIIEMPLSNRLTNDILMELVSKLKGRLNVLALINCHKITDDGLFRVVARIPHITQLHVPGCTYLSPEGVIEAVKFLSRNNHKLHTLKINGIYGLRKEHLQTLQKLIIPNQKHLNNILYHDYKKSSTLKYSNTNTHPIDVEICPKCDEVRMVFNCPRILCGCRGCDLCITRCVECGICFTGCDEEPDYANCGDVLCLECWIKLPKCSFCNKPCCNLHTDWLYFNCSTSTEFVCECCHLNHGY